MTTMPRPIYETKEDKDIDLAHLFGPHPAVEALLRRAAAQG